MGYSVIKHGKEDYEIIGATGSFAQFEDEEEVYSYIARDSCENPRLSFSDDKTARAILAKISMGLVNIGFAPLYIRYWAFVPVKVLKKISDGAYCKYYTGLFYKHYRGLCYEVNDEQEHAILDILVKAADIPGVYGMSDAVTTNLRAVSTVQGDVRFHICRETERFDDVAYRFKIARDTFMVFPEHSGYDPTNAEPPKYLNKYSSQLLKVEGNKAIYTYCVANYNDHDFFDDGVGGHEMDDEELEGAWKDFYRAKAINMLTKQLISNFGSEALSHIEICEDHHRDGFDLYNGEMYVDLAFDKDWLVEKRLKKLNLA